MLKLVLLRIFSHIVNSYKTYYVNSMKNIFILLALSWMLCSCTKTIFLTRTLPPELVPEKKPATVAFINQYDFAANPTIKDKHEVAYRTAVEEFGRTLATHQTADLSFSFSRADTLRRSDRAAEYREEPIPAEEVKELCASRNAGYVLILDTLHLGFDWETIREEDMDGSVSKTKNFFLLGDYYLSLYESSGTLVKRTFLDKSVFYRARPTLSGLITFVPNLARGTDEIRMMSRDAGSQYIGMFYPSNVNESRMLHAGKKFSQTNSLLVQQEYDMAIELLKDMARSPDYKLSQKALHNLSVAQEIRKMQQEGHPIFPVIR